MTASSRPVTERPRIVNRTGEVALSILKRYGTLIFTLLLCLFFGVLSPYFLTTSNLMNVFRQATVVTVIALGLTFVLAAGGFDISIGAVAGFCNVLTAYLLQQGLPFWAAASIAVGAGLVLGTINGFTAVKLGINAFLATVSMMFIASGLDLALSKGGRVMVSGENLVLSRQIGVGRIGGVPILLLVLLVICALCYLVLNRTRFGRYFYAIGGSPRCAYVSGIPLTRYAWLTYSLCGMLAGLGGVLLTARLSSGVPLAGTDLLGNAINAAFIGMTFLTIGVPNVPGTLLGGVLLAILGNGFVLLNVPFYYQYVLWGLVVVLAVAFSGSGVAEAVVVVRSVGRSASAGLSRFVSRYGTVILMVLVALAFGIMRPAFFRFSNLMDIMRYATPVAIMAIGLTFVVGGGGFDISLGSVASLTSVLTAFALSQGHPLWLAVIEALLAGLVLGSFSGFLCGKVGINPFVATLATLLIAMGPQYMMSGGGLPVTINDQPVLNAIGKGRVGSVPVLVFVLIAVVVIAHVFLSHTKKGAHIRALGGSPAALHISGVSVTWTSAFTYVLSGFLAALAGILLAARLSSGQTKVAEPYLMDTIAAVFLGYAFFSQGKANVLGTLAGALFMGMITNGLTMVGVPLWGDYLFRGLLVFAAVALSGVGRK
jgi:ribose/xylose/arabinose/galactoside ABC-type transport system permease subunit